MTADATRRFETKVKKSDDGCHTWLASRGTAGYGQFKLYDATIGAHRAAYMLYIGPIPEGLYVCHECDNKLCVNPEHLFVGTQKDNMRDMDRKGRRTVVSRATGYGRINDKDIAAVKFLHPFLSNRAISRTMGNLSHTTVNRILLGGIYA